MTEILICVTIRLKMLSKDPDLRYDQIENAFKDPEEKNSSDGIEGNSDVYKKFEASVVKLQLT